MNPNTPTSVASPSMAWVCGHSLAGIAFTNPAGGINKGCVFYVTPTEQFLTFSIIIIIIIII
jgi:polyribonucleotide nucleotidyltransferase